MKKLYLITLFIVASAITGFAQDNKYPMGIYMGIGEILEKTPHMAVELTVEQRTAGNIRAAGGNDYELISADKSVKKKFIKNEMLAYSDGETLFLNGNRLKLQLGYIAVVHSGDYFVFRAAESVDSKAYKRQKNNAVTMGVLFGAIGGAITAASQDLGSRFLYVYDTNDLAVKLIDAASLQELLSQHEHLLQAFMNEQNKDDEGVHLKYLELLNAQ